MNIFLNQFVLRTEKRAFMMTILNHCYSKLDIFSACPDKVLKIVHLGISPVFRSD